MVLRVASRRTEGPAGILRVEVPGESRALFFLGGEYSLHPFTPSKQRHARDSGDLMLQPSGQESSDPVTQGP